MESHVKNETRFDNLQKMYEQNITLFKNEYPDIAILIENQKTKHYTLGIDDYNEFNIWCQTKWLYDSPSSLYAQHQVQKSLHNPEVVCLTPENNEKSTGNIEKRQYRYLQQFYLDKIREVSPKNKTKTGVSLTSTDSTYTPSIVIFGNGLGQHVDGIVSKIRFDQLFIYEPELDFFLLSLFVTDYQKIHSLLNKNQKIIFVINKTNEQLYNEIQKSMMPLSIYKGTQIQMIQHYGGKKTTDAAEYITYNYGRLFDNMGFMEDECVGVAHFLKNLENPVNFIRSKTTEKKWGLPVIIVGSGPSLDKDIHHLHKIQHQVIIMSCSSSISALYHQNITPDFHVLCERTHDMAEFLSDFTDKKYLKKIHLLSLNCCHPRLRSFFGGYTIGFKLVDIGTTLWQQLPQEKDESTAILQSSGPTSGNCALSFAVEMNFDTIILIGIDFAQKNEQKHHSDYSLYNVVDALSDTSYTTQHSVKGNFCPSIRTSLLLNKGRCSAEALLAKNNITCINCSDGAFIFGTQPQKFTSVITALQEDATQNFNKSAIIDEVSKKTTILFSHQRVNKTLDILKQNWSEVLLKTNTFTSTLLLSLTPQDYFMWIEHFDTVERMIQNQYHKNTTVVQLIIGSLSGLQTAISTILFHNRCSLDFMQMSHQLKIIWNEAIQEVATRCIDTCGKTDDELLNTIDGLLEQLT